MAAVERPEELGGGEGSEDGAGGLQVSPAEPGAVGETCESSWQITSSCHAHGHATGRPAILARLAPSSSSALRQPGRLTYQTPLVSRPAHAFSVRPTRTAGIGQSWAVHQSDATTAAM
jgi:hypothetical protein